MTTLKNISKDEQYKKLPQCEHKVGKGICGSKDLCSHKGWPTLCKGHCKKW